MERDTKDKRKCAIGALAGDRCEQGMRHRGRGEGGKEDALLGAYTLLTHVSG